MHNLGKEGELPGLEGLPRSSSPQESITSAAAAEPLLPVDLDIPIQQRAPGRV